MSTFRSPRSGNRRSVCQGFTLIELLVVLVILGISVAVIGVNFASDPRRSLQTEAQRLALLLEQARDEAMSTGSGIAFSAEDGGYRFWQRRAVADAGVTPDGQPPGTAWKPAEDKEVFQPRRFPASVTLAEIRIDGQAPDKENARIVFSPSGRMPPFRLTLASGNYRATVSGGVSGCIEVGEGVL